MRVPRTDPRAPRTTHPRNSAPLPGSDSGLNYFAHRVGAEAARLLQVGTPFDYERQMKLYVVGKMPDPRGEGYRDALIHWIEHFVKLTHGKAFVLFTNFKLMQEVGELMQPFFDKLGIACFVQGTGTPRSVMLEKFKEDVDSVLFGTDSFWQGVDVPGEALSNVIITRLPFAVPDHPADRGAHRGHRSPRRQFLRRVLAARGHPQVPPGRRPPHPHQDRPGHHRRPGQPHPHQAIRPGLHRRPAQVPGGSGGVGRAPRVPLDALALRLLVPAR